MRKVDKSSYRFVQCLLICIFFQLATPCFGKPEHSGVGIHKERTTEGSIGNLYMFVLYVLASEYGKKLDKQAKCPVYCGVDHKHRYEEKESHIQPVNRVPRPATSEDREQSEVVLRTCPDVHRLCGDDRQIGETE